jgi:tetratricopeptide (TPR) repeat protein
MGSTCTIPPPIEQAQNSNTGTPGDLRRKLVHAVGFCVYVLLLVGLMYIPAARPWRGLLYRGQVFLILGYVWGINQIRHRVLFLIRNGRCEQAVRLNRILSILPLSGGSLEGFILFEQGRYREAQAYLRPLAFDATGNPKLGSTELYCYALALENDGRPADAEPLLDAAVKVSPEKDALKVALAGCLLAEEKDPERARGLLEQVMAGPGQARLTAADKAHRIARYAWALAACGRRSEAQQQIDAALAAGQGLSPGDLAGVYYFVGEAWRAQREDQKARDAFARAVELRPDGVIAKSVQKALAKLDASER